MRVITLSVEIPEDRRLIIEVPDDMPTGLAEITIQASRSISAPAVNLARDAARARLLAAGALSPIPNMPAATTFASDEEMQRLTQGYAHGKTLDEMIDEDR